MQKNIVKLIMGKGAGQALQLLSILALSRLYTPAQHGILGQVQSYATVGAVIASLQLHLSLPLSKDGPQAREDLGYVVMVAYLFLGVALPLSLFADAALRPAVAVAFLIALSNTFGSFLVYEGKFGSLSRFYVFRSLTIITVQITLGVYGVDGGLVWGTVMGEAITAVYLAYASGNRIVPRLPPVFAQLAAFLSRRRSFAVYGTLQELVSVLAFYAPLLLYGLYYGDAVAGQYAMGVRLIWAPAVLVSGSLAQVLYHRVGQTDAGLALKPSFLFLPHSAYYVILALAPILCYVAHDAIVFALGPTWGMAAAMMPMMLAWACIFIASTPARVVFRMRNQQKRHLLVDLMSLTVICGLFGLFALAPLQLMAALILVAILQASAIIFLAYRTIVARGSA